MKPNIAQGMPAETVAIEFRGETRGVSTYTARTELVDFEIERPMLSGRPHRRPERRRLRRLDGEKETP